MSNENFNDNNIHHNNHNKKPGYFLLIIIVITFSVVGTLCAIISKVKTSNHYDAKQTTNNNISIKDDPIIENDASTESNELYSHITNKDYREMLEYYSNIFTEQLSIISTQQVSTLLEQNADTQTVINEIDNVLSELSSAEQTLSDYYEEFDNDRTKAPMGTKIMTLLSDAQSAVTQYQMAFGYLNTYLTAIRDQKYIEKFQIFTQKATDSLNDYNDVLNAEKISLGI